MFLLSIKTASGRAAPSTWTPKLKYGKPFGVRRFIAALATAYWLDQAACCREFHKPLAAVLQAI